MANDQSGVNSLQMLYPQGQAQQQAIQQQQALAQALLQQGLSPVDTNNRMAGQIAYKISPYEGLAKLASVLTGGYERNQANKQQLDLNSMYAPIIQNAFGIDQKSPVDTSNTSSPPIDAQRASIGLPMQSDMNAQGMSTQPPIIPVQRSPLQLPGKSGMDSYILSSLAPDAYQRALAANLSPTDLQKNASDPRFGDSIINQEYYKSYPGIAKTQEVLGTNYAGALPYGTAPQGAGGVSSNMSQIPPISASALLPPMGGGRAMPQPMSMPQGLPTNSGNANFAPSPSPQGISADQYKAAMDAWKAGQSANATETGKNLAEAQKGAASIDARIDNAKDMINRMLYGEDDNGNILPGNNLKKGMAANVTHGIMPEIKMALHNQADDAVSALNGRFMQLNNNLFTQELPGLVQSAGGRVDIPLINSIKEASSVPIDESPSAKIKRLQGLSNLLDKVQQNAHNFVGNISGQAPTISSSYFTPQQIQAEIARRTTLRNQGGQ